MPNQYTARLLMTVIILVLSLAALIAPFYPESIPQLVTTQYSYTVTTQTYASQQVFSLIIPVRLNASQSGLLIHIGNMYLVEGSLTTIQTTGCQSCVIVISEHWNPKVHVLTLFGEGNVTFIAPGTAQYDILATNLGSTAQTINQLTIISNVPNVSRITTNGNYTYTSSSVHNVSPVLTNPIISSILAAIVVISVLLLHGTMPKRKR